MKNQSLLLYLLCITLTIAIAGCRRGKETTNIPATPTATNVPTTVPVSLPYPIYSEQTQIRGSFIPSGWMGDTKGISMDESSTDNPYLGEVSLQIQYQPFAEDIGWAGIYWLPRSFDTGQNWGSQNGGINLSGASTLTFWARGQQGNEKIEFFIGGIEGSLGDTAPKTSLSTTITTNWQQYSIPLGGLSLERVVGAFGWTAEKSVIFWLDEIWIE